MKHSMIITPAVVGIAVFIASNVIASAQPDGIDPPAGPVADTQPSLTSIDAKLDTLALSSNRFPPDLKYAYDQVGGNQQSETVTFVSANEADFVRLYGVTVHASSTNLLVGPSTESVALIAGSAALTSGQIGGSSYVDLGGLRVPTPVKFQTGGQDSASTITLLYWIEE